jgi:hypothetical protein
LTPKIIDSYPTETFNYICHPTHIHSSENRKLSTLQLINPFSHH